MSNLPATERPSFTSDELARWLGVSTATVHQMRKQKRLPGAFHVGRQVRYDKQKIADWVEQGGTKAAA